MFFEHFSKMHSKQNYHNVSQIVVKCASVVLRLFCIGYVLTLRGTFNLKLLCFVKIMGCAVGTMTYKKGKCFK